MSSDTHLPFGPYAPARNVLTLIRRDRDHRLPDVLGPADAVRLGVPEGNVPRTLQALRFLGLIDENNRRTLAFDRISSASTVEYSGVFADIVRSAYEPVFALIDPSRATDRQVHDAFRGYRPQGQRARMISLFRALCAEAGIVGRHQPSRWHGSLETKSGRRARGLSPRSAQSTPLAGEGLDSTAHLRDYHLLQRLLEELPRDSTWTSAQRERWLQAFTASLDLLVEIIDQRKP